MQSAHLYEPILLVNRGVDEAVRGLGYFMRAKDPQLDSLRFDEGLVLFQDRRARLNFYFRTTLEHRERQDSVRFEAPHHEYEKRTLDEVQVYRDVWALEDRRRGEGRPPKMRSLTPEERRQWERERPRPSADVPRTEGGAIA
ncbi:MAG: hypothetical protein WB987_07670 [Candidatus Acidiferrales bacterium]